MKRTLLFFAAAGAFLSVAGAPVKFTGIDFETWDSKNNLPGQQPKWRWTLPPAKAPFAVMEQSSAEKHSGNFSLHLKDDSKAAVNHAIGYSFSPAELKKYSGSIITFSAWVKQAAASGPNVVGISIWAVDGETGKSSHAEMGVPTTQAADWTELKQKMRLPAKTKQLIVYLRCAQGWGCTGEAWFDDVTITFDDVKTTAKPAAAPAKAAKVDAEKKK